MSLFIIPCSSTLKRKVHRSSGKTTTVHLLWSCKSFKQTENIYLWKPRGKTWTRWIWLFQDSRLPLSLFDPIISGWKEWKALVIKVAPRDIISSRYPVLLQELMLSFTSSPPGATPTPPASTINPPPAPAPPPPPALTPTPPPPAACSYCARIVPRLPTGGEVHKTEAKALLAHSSQNIWKNQIYEDQTSDNFGNG